jgi:phasin family protein
MAKTVKTKAAAPAKAAAKKPAAIKAAKTRAKAADAAPIAQKVAEVIETIQPKVKKTMTDTAKTAMEKGSKMFKDVVEFHKGNAEAVIESGKIAAKGAQEMGQFAAENGRKNWDATTAMLKQATAVKSPADLMKLQGEFARERFDAGVAQFSKSTELFFKLAGDAIQPLQSRYAVAAEKVKSYAL